MFTWFITGASRGFGRQLTAAVLEAGDQVIATARDPQTITDAFPDAGDKLAAVALDVTDAEQAASAVAAGVERFDSIDVVVNNAGYGLFGSVEDTPDDDVRALFDTNVFGLLNVTRAVVPVLREQGHGRILNMSSSAGFAAGAGRGLYGASKFAVEAISEALRDELAPLGIQVTVIEPGSFRTDFLTPTSRRQAERTSDAYADSVGKLLDALKANDGKQPGDPAKAVKAIVELATASEPPLRLQLGTDAVSLVENKLDLVASELATWRATSLSTDFKDA